MQCQKIGQYLNEMMQLPGILEIEEVSADVCLQISVVCGVCGVCGGACACAI
jgi:hypothetical protein